MKIWGLVGLYFCEWYLWFSYLYDILYIINNESKDDSNGWMLLFYMYLVL